MTLTLTYDDQLSRVRVRATGVNLDDPFTRTVTDGWGTAPTGHVWMPGGAAPPSGHSVDGSAALHSHAAVNVLMADTTDVGLSDHTLTASVTVPVVPTGASITAWSFVRARDLSNYYASLVYFGTDGAVSIALVKREDGTLSVIRPLVSAGTYTAGQQWRIKTRVSGSTISAKAWQASTAEPASWQVTVTDTSIVRGTAIGCGSRLESGNTDTLPVVVSWDDVSVTLSAVPVERSTDGIRWETVRGGAALEPVGGAVSLDDYEFVPDVENHYRVAAQVGSIMPTIDGVWLKSVARPFLNRKVEVRTFSDVTRPSRAGIFEVVGRTMPVAVTDVRSSRRWTLYLWARDADEAADLDLLLASGDILFVQAPRAGRLSAVPSGYVSAGDTSEQLLPTHDLALRQVSVPCVEVAPPGPDVVGATLNWQTVLNTYATWADVLEAHPTWADLLELIGAPTDVIVQ